ncbi:DUF3810 domain-containing protein [bacterium]|nr:DUF3810 domain-containing protein [bacterium]
MTLVTLLFFVLWPNFKLSRLLLQVFNLKVLLINKTKLLRYNLSMRSLFKNNPGIKHPWLRRFIIMIISGLLLLAAYFLGLNESSAEFWARHIQRYWVYAFGHISSILPFSLFEILVLVALLFTLIWLVLFFKKLFKGRFIKALNSLVDIVLVYALIIAIYAFVTGPSYKRAPLNFPNYSEEISSDKVKTIALAYIDNFNTVANDLERDSAGSAKLRLSLDELHNLISEEYQKLNDDYFSSYSPKTKYLLNSWFLSEMQTTGISFSLTGENHVNKLMPPVEIPFTLAHELAHSKGVMREDDANLCALLVCLNSDNSFIKYSAYFRACPRLLSAVYYSCSKEDFEEVQASLSSLVLNEYANYDEYWEEHKFFSEFQVWLNDLYLKSQGISTGVDSYIDQEDAQESGTYYPDGSPVYVVTYSPMQQLLFSLYDQGEY